MKDLPNEHRILQDGDYVLTNQRFAKMTKNDQRYIFLPDVSLVGYIVSQNLWLLMLGAILVVVLPMVLAEVDEYAAILAAIPGAICLLIFSFTRKKVISVVSHSGETIYWQRSQQVQETLDAIFAAKQAYLPPQAGPAAGHPAPQEAPLASSLNLDVSQNLDF